MTLHPSVVAHTHRIPCLTTPAPSESGRAAPKKLKGRIPPDAKARWLQDSRQYAPWQYQAEALLHDTKGQMHVPTPEAKEQFHQLPRGFTSADGVSTRARHRMLANGWHAGVARLMLFLVVSQLCQQPTQAALPPQVELSTLQWIQQQLCGHPGLIGPGGWPSQPSCIPPASSMWDHWKLSATATHPLDQPPQLDPGMQQAMSFQCKWKHDIGRIRRCVVDEVESLIEAHQADTLTWWENLPEHIQRVYFDPDHQQVTQIPLLLDLLQLTGYPGLTDLHEDLSQGFAVTGKLHPGTGWTPRTDEKYSWPIDTVTFLRLNRQYTIQKLRQGRADPHWKEMLEELREERRLGRLSGPFTSPSWWPIRSVSFENEELIPLPDEEIAISFCFSVTQSDKIRRCEDFRRSGHNATVQVHDTPPHDDVDKFINVAKAYAKTGTPSQIWSQDLSGAYRQFPVRNPSDNYCAIITEYGPMLFKHHALTFGAVASVWSFNRCADALTFLSRRLLATTVGHYVDDFIGVEDDDTVMSGYEEFTRLFRILGLRMKEKKALAPSPSHKILGIQVQVQNEQAVLSPHPDRVNRMKTSLKECLQADAMSADTAHSIAGKLMFLCSTVFGQLGKAAMKPIYGRAHGLQTTGHTDTLNVALKQGILTLLNILDHLQPRVIPFVTGDRPTCLYTDAYFLLGENYMSPGDQIPLQWSKAKAPQLENGWGFVCRLDGETVFGFGRVPPYVLKESCGRRAFIYFLEVAAQLFALTLLRSTANSRIISWIDNRAGLFALTKGYGRDANVNCLLGLFWRLATHQGWHLHLAWVQSDQNISDRVSRQDTSQMMEIDARRVQFDLSPLFKILCRVARGSEYAHGRALHDLLQLQQEAL